MTKIIVIGDISKATELASKIADELKHEVQAVALSGQARTVKPSDQKFIFQHEIPDLLKGGQICTITFYKKNGEKRVLNGRSGVSKYVNKDSNSKPRHGVITVFETNTDRKGKDCYRSIRLDSITEIKAHKKTYRVASPFSS